MNLRVMTLILGTTALLSGVVNAATPVDTAGLDESNVTVVVGPLIGVPSGVALIAGIVAGPVSVKASGGYWGDDWNGIQADIGWVFDHEAVLTQGLSVVAGVFRVNPILMNEQGTLAKTVRQERYVGVAYEANYSGFYLQAGLAKASGDYPNPELLLQAGYLIPLP